MEPQTFNEKKWNTSLIEFCQQLVRTRSFSGEEGALAKIIERQMTSLDFDIVTIDRWGNVIGQVGNGKRSLLFDSHMDTVQVHDAELWDEPPFSGTVKEGYLWGRGSVDMKSGLAASVYAAAAAKNHGWLDGKTVFIVCSTLEEDCDGEGLKYAMETIGRKPDYGVICEPSSNVISTGHKGKAQIIVTARGVSAHGSAPEKGKNAVYEMAEIIQRVERTNLDLMKNPGRHGTLVLSDISSTAVSLNAVPSECRIYLDRRMVVGETEQTIHDEMDRIIAGKDAYWEIDTMRRHTWTGESVTYRPLHPAWEIDREHDLAKAFTGAYGDVYGIEPNSFDYWDFSTDAVALISHQIPVIGFGPGEHKLAHMRNEKCAVSQILEACAVYSNAIRRLAQ